MQEKESKTSTHFWISLIKSGIRMGACWKLFQGELEQAAGMFCVAEVLGVAEEIF